MKYTYDLHTHSCLSPCGDMDMTPNNVVNMASILGCNILAISDHNTCKNAPAFVELGKKLGILVVPGMELCTTEEAHVLCLFDSLDGAMEFDKFVYEKIPPIKNKEKIFGVQQILDSNDIEVGIEERLLITAADISAMDIMKILEDFGGVAVPAHVDKSSYSLIASLGDIPPECGFKTIELSQNTSKEDFLKNYPHLKDMAFLKDSDSHYLENMPDVFPVVELESLDLKELISKIKNGSI